MNRLAILFLICVNLHFIRALYSLNGLLNVNGASRLKTFSFRFVLLTSNELISIGYSSTSNGKLTDEFTCKTEDGKSKIFFGEISR